MNLRIPLKEHIKEHIEDDLYGSCPHSLLRTSRPNFNVQSLKGDIATLSRNLIMRGQFFDSKPDATPQKGSLVDSAAGNAPGGSRQVKSWRAGRRSLNRLPKEHPVTR